MRKLTIHALDAPELQTLLNSERLVLTSHFGLHVFLTRYAADWRRQHPSGELVVLSAGMARQARDAGITHVHTPPKENRRSLMAYLAALDADEAVNGTLVLTGDLHVPEQTGMSTLVIYDNLWTDREREHDRREIAEYARTHGRFTKVLVTSSSAFRRLDQIARETPGSFDHPEYYVLGPSTEAEIHRAGKKVVAPRSSTDVLRQSILQMLGRQRG